VHSETNCIVCGKPRKLNHRCSKRVEAALDKEVNYSNAPFFGTRLEYATEMLAHEELKRERNKQQDRSVPRSHWSPDLLPVPIKIVEHEELGVTIQPKPIGKARRKNK